MDWCGLDKGENIHLVGKMLIFDFEHDRHVMEVFPSKQQFFLSGLLHAGYESYTLFDATLVSQYPVPSVALNHQVLCSVIRILHGTVWCLWSIVAVGLVDSLRVFSHVAFIQQLRWTTMQGWPTFSQSILCAFRCWGCGWQANHLSALEGLPGIPHNDGGFSCQPFSSLGDRKSSEDARSSCLTKILSAAFYLRIHILVLECVCASGQWLFRENGVRAFLQSHWFFMHSKKYAIGSGMAMP